MNSEEPNTYVNKPYSEKEMEQKVEKLRNDLSKKMDKWANRIQVSMAVMPKVQRVEGEIWLEDNRKYTFKDGVKQSVSLMESARMPHWCPKCTVPMNHRFDRKFYYLRGWCYNCNIEWEGKMRLDGTWDAFEQRMLRENEKAFLRDKIQEHLSYINTFTVPTIYFEDGRYERLAHISHFEDLFDKLNKDIEFMIARLEHIRHEEEHDNTITGSTDNMVEQV